VKVLLIGVGAKICCTGNTDSVVAESIFTTIGAVVDKDLIDIFLSYLDSFLMFYF
jgi:hypothetical protein